MKLSPEQCADVSLDILTGFHLVDGKERMVVVEGRVEGAMNIMQVRGQRQARPSGQRGGEEDVQDAGGQGEGGS